MQHVSIQKYSSPSSVTCSPKKSILCHLSYHSALILNPLKRDLIFIFAPCMRKCCIRRNSGPVRSTGLNSSPLMCRSCMTWMHLSDQDEKGCDCPRMLSLRFSLSQMRFSILYAKLYHRQWSEYEFDLVLICGDVTKTE